MLIWSEQLASEFIRLDDLKISELCCCPVIVQIQDDILKHSVSQSSQLDERVH